MIKIRCGLPSEACGLGKGDGKPIVTIGVRQVSPRLECRSSVHEGTELQEARPQGASSGGLRVSARSRIVSQEGVVGV